MVPPVNTTYQPPALSIVVVSYKRLDELLMCVDDLSVQDIQVPFEVVLVLQGYSEIETATISQRTKSLSAATAVAFPKGIGVHAARNAGVETAKGDIIGFVDDDCRIPSHWARVLVGAFRDPQIGAVGGFVRHPGLRNGFRDWLYPLLGVSASRYRIDWGGFSAGPVVTVPNVEQDADWLSGCNMAFSRAAVQKTGEFDTGYGLYGFDDVDYCLRVRQAGFVIRALPVLTVDHFPSPKNRTASTQLVFEEERRRWRFAKKALGHKSCWKVRYLLRFTLHFGLLLALSIRVRSTGILINAVRGSIAGYSDTTMR